MSKHWRPEGNVVPFRRARRRRVDWTKAGAYAPRGAGDALPRPVLGMMLGCVIAFGGIVGWSMAPDPAEATSAGERLSFGSCEWGGGMNCVVDGDTIHLHGAKIRIAGIDAPETHDLYRCDAELALGKKAAARLQQLLNSGAVSTSAIDRDRDAYGRKLRNVAVDGRDVGEVLIGEGLAREYGSGRRGWC